ncbi:hypothetical protein HPB51_005724 [Rhipicephalus microplus]|uniref:Uncharacterized protein n=1 Tax=Rhipicephalus microplus TaxID=6941 RepID=A0A9J6DFZ1_RHIMP|nr:hypothetical protein HPB51_005724 [Rhipicephalus microplus]
MLTSEDLRVPLKKDLVCPEAAKYSEDHSLRLHPVQKKLMEVTKSHYFGSMLGDSCQLQFFQILLKTMSAKKYLEIARDLRWGFQAITVSNLSGYSAVSAALALPPDGKVVALDLYENLVNVGRPHWKEAGVEDKIEMRFGQAVESLDALLSEGQAGTFDFVFIDADKENYDKYYERSLQLLRKNGLIAIDNVLWRGLVYDPSDKSTEVAALREFNKKLHEDERIDVCLLPLADGITFARKRVEYEKKNGVNASTASIAPRISSEKENFSVSGRRVLQGVPPQASTGSLLIFKVTGTFLAQFLRHTLCLGSKFAIDKLCDTALALNSLQPLADGGAEWPPRSSVFSVTVDPGTTCYTVHHAKKLRRVPQLVNGELRAQAEGLAEEIRNVPVTEKLNGQSCGETRLWIKGEASQPLRGLSVRGGSQNSPVVCCLPRPSDWWIVHDRLRQHANNVRKKDDFLALHCDKRGCRPVFDNASVFYRHELSRIIVEAAQLKREGCTGMSEPFM